MKNTRVTKQPTIFTVKNCLVKHPQMSKTKVTRWVIEKDLYLAGYDSASVTIPKLFRLIEEGRVSSPSNISRRYSEIVELYPSLGMAGRDVFNSAPTLLHLPASPILRDIANDPNRNDKNEWIGEDGEMYGAVKDDCFIIPKMQLYRYDRSSECRDEVKSRAAKGLPETYLQHYPEAEVKYKRLGNSTSPKRLSYIIPLIDIDTYRKED